MIFGFSRRRFKEWWWVVQIEAPGHKAKILLFLHMAKMMLRHGFVSRAEWRQRIRSCARCPVQDNALRRCRPMNGSRHGCGCYIPFLATLKGDHCYADRELPGSGFGWKY